MIQYIIGTAPRAQEGQIPVKVNDEKFEVSRNHCKVTVYGNRALIEDIGSLNGTFVDGVKINTPTEVTIHSNILLAGKIPLNIADFINLPQKQHERPENENHKGENLFQSGLIYAGFIQRLLAFILDGIIVGVPYWVVVFIVVSSISLAPAVSLLIQLAALLMIIHFYFAVPISKRGTTVGRKIMKIQYLGSDTLDYPTVEKVWLRTIAYGFSAVLLGIGFLLSLFTEKKQALHDLLANTIVVTQK